MSMYDDLCLKFIHSDFERLRQAISAINRIHIGKFPALLMKLLSKLPDKSQRYFTTDEEFQLIKMFNLSKEELNTALNACGYIFEQSAFYSITPESLYDVLIEGGLDIEYSEVQYYNYILPKTFLNYIHFVNIILY